MSQYLSLINDIYTTINDNNLSPIDKSTKIIGKIQSNVKLDTSTDMSTTDCSRFPNKIIGFLCKLDKNKSKLCNLPGAISFVIGKDKINAVISFITTNKAFIDSVLQSLNVNEKTQLRQMIDSNVDILGKQNQSSDCITSIQTFLTNLKAGLKTIPQAESRSIITQAQTPVRGKEIIEEDADYYKERHADLTNEDLVGFRNDTKYSPELKNKYGLVPVLGGAKTRRKYKRKLTRGSKRRNMKRKTTRGRKYK